MRHSLAFTALLVLFQVSAPAADNTPPPGFTALFNGKDLSGWKGLVSDPPARARMKPEELARAQEAADQRMRDHWKVADGALVFDGKGDSLCTAKDYTDFELLVDWKILKSGDSGIYLRGSPQVQIWDNPEGSGGLYNNQKPGNPAKPLTKADRPIEEWNSFRITMTGEKVTVVLNDVLVVKDTVLENYWDRTKPIYPAGQIELQNHGNTLWFKNIYIREIPGAGAAPAARCVLKKGAKVAIVGDSITEQKLYSRFMEDYLVACLADMDLRTLQFGWGGEQASGFAGRMENDLVPWKPDVVTTCYGMNDGRYRAYEDSIGENYSNHMGTIVRRMKEIGAVMVVGSPGAVDTTFFGNPNFKPEVYNDNLAHLRDLARKVAETSGMPFANVHDPMIAAMEKGKAAFGKDYDVCGTDGVHPRPNGHLVMAYAFLKGMGLDGQLALFTLDLKGGASVSEGHTLVSSSGSAMVVQSRRYPFCFWGDAKSADGTLSILPFVPFNDDLNRFTLVVKNLEALKAKVSWDGISKSFSREALAQGINLAAEFPENPFSAQFRKIDELVAQKENFETRMIKEVITRFRVTQSLLEDDAEGKAALEKIRARLLARNDELHGQVRAAVLPIQHTITVIPE